MTLSRHKFKVRDCSDELLKLIDKKNFMKENPLPRRDGVIPWNRISVGQAIWFDLDMMNSMELRYAGMAAARYNLQYDGLFARMKHRGDNRVSGFRWLEIARIK